MAGRYGASQILWITLHVVVLIQCSLGELPRQTLIPYEEYYDQYQEDIPRANIPETGNNPSVSQRHGPSLNPQNQAENMDAKKITPLQTVGMESIPDSVATPSQFVVTQSDTVATIPKTTGPPETMVTQAENMVTQPENMVTHPEAMVTTAMVTTATTPSVTTTTGRGAALTYANTMTPSDAMVSKTSQQQPYVDWEASGSGQSDRTSEDTLSGDKEDANVKASEEDNVSGDNDAEVQREEVVPESDSHEENETVATSSVTSEHNVAHTQEEGQSTQSNSVYHQLVAGTEQANVSNGQVNNTFASKNNAQQTEEVNSNGNADNNALTTPDNVNNVSDARQEGVFNAIGAINNATESTRQNKAAPAKSARSDARQQGDVNVVPLQGVNAEGRTHSSSISNSNADQQTLVQANLDMNVGSGEREAQHLQNGVEEDDEDEEENEHKDDTASGTNVDLIQHYQNIPRHVFRTKNNPNITHANIQKEDKEPGTQDEHLGDVREGHDDEDYDDDDNDEEEVNEKEDEDKGAQQEYHHEHDQLEDHYETQQDQHEDHHETQQDQHEDHQESQQDQHEDHHETQQDQHEDHHETQQDQHEDHQESQQDQHEDHHETQQDQHEDHQESQQDQHEDHHETQQDQHEDHQETQQDQHDTKSLSSIHVHTPQAENKEVEEGGEEVKYAEIEDEGNDITRNQKLPFKERTKSGESDEQEGASEDKSNGKDSHTIFSVHNKHASKPHQAKHTKSTKKSTKHKSNHKHKKAHDKTIHKQHGNNVHHHNVAKANKHLFKYIHRIVSSEQKAPRKPPTCSMDNVRTGYSLRGGTRAGHVQQLGASSGMHDCVQRCCHQRACDVALLLDGRCFGVACFSKRLCELVKVPHPNFVVSKIAFLARAHRRDDILTPSEFGCKYGELQMRDEEHWSGDLCGGVLVCKNGITTVKKCPGLPNKPKNCANPKLYVKHRKGKCCLMKWRCKDKSCKFGGRVLRHGFSLSDQLCTGVVKCHNGHLKMSYCPPIPARPANCANPELKVITRPGKCCKKKWVCADKSCTYDKLKVTHGEKLTDASCAVIMECKNGFLKTTRCPSPPPIPAGCLNPSLQVRRKLGECCHMNWQCATSMR